MEHQYELFLKNLSKRRWDEVSKAYIYSQEFTDSNYADCIKYVLESMKKVDSKFYDVVYSKAQIICDKIEKGIADKGYKVEFRFQGPLRNDYPIDIYGHLDIIMVRKTFTNQVTQDVNNMAFDVVDILSGDKMIKSLDFFDQVKIQLNTQPPSCTINIFPSVWLNTKMYKTSKNETYRGVAIFDFENKIMKKLFPFLFISRINDRNQKTNHNFLKVVRLLQCIVADDGQYTDLNEEEIATIVYHIPQAGLMSESNKPLSILPVVTKTLNNLSKSTVKLKKLKSITEKEAIFAGKENKISEVKKLATSLNSLQKDLKKELKKIDLTVDSELS